MEFRDLVREDSKRQFRNAQIEAEGNDPVETGKSYGTPHDLASLYGKGRMYTNPGGVPEPDKYAADDPKLGRPVKQKVKRVNLPSLWARQGKGGSQCGHANFK